MSAKPQATEEQLLAAIFKQIDPSIRIDYVQLAQDLGITGGKNNAAAAAKRWLRYREKHGLISKPEKATKKDGGADKKGEVKAEKAKVPVTKKRKLLKEETKDDE